ncbi:retrovirus-related pol polyprotein from transposon TNT 1-94 [Tanacetum coccineum]|uniref:Retrovirus-related pol polyprotein from transposon TNT 1-94 n=1 Tax=Tanacetum coccineum TaxID=301880 RepID=A0ABQ5G8K2_9ASTR
MSMWIISRGVVLLILLMEYKVLRDFLLHRSSINNSASLSNKFGGSYFSFKFGISGLLHHVITIIADRIRDKDTSQSKQNLQSSSMTFIHKTLIIPSVLDSYFISSTVCEVKRFATIMGGNVYIRDIIDFDVTMSTSRGSLLALKMLRMGLRISKKLKHEALSLYMGNGMRAAVEAIRSFDLILPCGLIIVLDNYMHNLYPNVSFTFNVSNKRVKYSLDSSYLWHCRLRHIHKKRMDKLQSEGILQSTHDESLEKCYPKETTGYYFYYPPENKIFVARNAEFFENSLIVQEASGSRGLLKTSGSDEGLELIQEEDTQPFENTSEERNEVVPIKVEPQNVKVPIRRSARIPQAPDRYGFYVDGEEYELGDLNEPPNYKVSLSKWLFKKETDMDGNVHTFKARLVAKGYTQTYGVDYGETFFPVADIKAIMILLAISRSKCLSRENHKKFRMKNSKKGYTLIMEKPDYRKSHGAKTPSETNKDDTKSQTGYVFVLNGGVVDWKSAKQSTIAMSSTKSEYITAAEVSIEVV